MTFEEIDRALAGWNTRLAAVADNLLELQGDATFQVLTGAGGRAKLPLTGVTAARVEPALASMEGLFGRFGLLQGVVDEAARLRRDAPTLRGRDQARQRIEFLLLGSSVEVPAEVVSLEERTLLSGSQGARTAKPEEMLLAMSATFTAARDTVLLVTETWDELSAEIDAAEGELKRMGVEAAALGVMDGAAEAVLGRVKGALQSDPLGALDVVRGELRPALEVAKNSLRVRMEVRDGLAEAHRALGRQAARRQEIAEAAAVCREKILAAPAVVAGDDALREWLGRLERRQHTELAGAMLVGLRRWHAEAQAEMERDRERMRTVQEPVETRNELRGRMHALKSKAQAFGLAEETTLMELGAQAEALLYTRPVDLQRAVPAVAAYEQRLRGAGKGTR